MFQAYGEPFFRLIKIGYLIERLKLPCFRPLAVVHMEERKPVLFMRDRGGDATIHASADEHDCKVLFHAVSLPVSSSKFYRYLKRNMKKGSSFSVECGLAAGILPQVDPFYCYSLFAPE